jgi:hypothetical protein
MLIYATVNSILMIVTLSVGATLNIPEISTLAFGFWAGMVICLGTFLYCDNRVDEAKMRRILEEMRTMDR